MFGKEQRRHYPTVIPPEKFCTNRACPNHAKSVKFGRTCNECGHEVRER